MLTASACAYAWFIGKAYATLLDVRAWWRPIPPILALLALGPFIEQGQGHIYDFTALAVMAGLLYAIVASRWVLYMGIFLVGCFNKETVIFGTMLLLCANWKYRRSKQVKWLLLVQVAAFVAIQASIRLTFKHNPGAPVEHYWRFHLDWLLQRNFVEMVSLSVVVGFFVKGVRDLPQVLRRSSLVLIPGLLLYFVAGYPGEFRIFYDVVPLLVLMLSRNIELGLGRALGLTPSSEREGDLPVLATRYGATPTP
jgi:hypothetical protein